jgi:hypothetical protein
LSQVTLSISSSLARVLGTGVPRADFGRDNGDDAGLGREDGGERLDAVLGTTDVDVKDGRVLVVAVELGDTAVVHEGVKVGVGGLDMCGGGGEGRGGGNVDGDDFDVGKGVGRGG